MSPALAVVNLARIEVVRKWDYRHFGAQCLLVAHSFRGRRSVGTEATEA